MRKQIPLDQASGLVLVDNMLSRDGSTLLLVVAGNSYVALEAERNWSDGANIKEVEMSTYALLECFDRDALVTLDVLTDDAIGEFERERAAKVKAHTEDRERRLLAELLAKYGPVS